MNLINVRPAAQGDLDTIVLFNTQLAKESEGILLEPDTLSAGVGAVLGDISKARYFLAETLNALGTLEIAGQLMITYEWSDWRNGMFVWIQSVYVREAYRRKGVFRALFQHVQEFASTSEYCGIRLYVHDDNRLAQQIYLRLGMIEAGYKVLETPDELKDLDKS